MQRCIESQQVAQTSMESIASHEAEKGKGMHEATGIMVMHPKWLHPNKECNHTTTNPLRALTVAKPRTREANTSIKHRHANWGDPNLLYGPWCMEDDKDHRV